MKTVTATLEDIWAVSYKAKESLSHDLTTDFLGIYPIDLKIYVHTKTCIQMFMNFIYNRQNLEAAKIFRSGMNKQNMLHSHNEKLFCDKKK